MTHICVMSSHKPIKIYMGDLVLGVNTLYRLFCFFKLFPVVGKGLNTHINSFGLYIMEEVHGYIVECLLKILFPAGNIITCPACRE